MSEIFLSLCGYFYVKKLRLSYSDWDECYVIASILRLIGIEIKI